MSNEDKEHDEDEYVPGFFFRFRFVIGGILFLALAGGMWWMFGGDKPKRSAPKKQEIVNVTLPPPPPPPPPPPKERPPEPEVVEEKETEFVPEEAADVPEEAPADDAPAVLGTGIVGDGPADGFGLGTKGGGGKFGGIGGKGGAGSKYGAYAGKVQRSIADRLRSHKKTRTAQMSIKVRIWADANGRVTRAALSGTTGDPQLDRALREEVLPGTQLPEAPPDGMPMPIVMRLTASRP